MGNYHYPTGIYLKAICQVRDNRTLSPKGRGLGEGVYVQN